MSHSSDGMPQRLENIQFVVETFEDGAKKPFFCGRLLLADDEEAIGRLYPHILEKCGIADVQLGVSLRVNVRQSDNRFYFIEHVYFSLPDSTFDTAIVRYRALQSGKGYIATIKHAEGLSINIFVSEGATNLVAVDDANGIHVCIQPTKSLEKTYYNLEKFFLPEETCLRVAKLQEDEEDDNSCKYTFHVFAENGGVFNVSLDPSHLQAKGLAVSVLDEDVVYLPTRLSNQRYLNVDTCFNDNYSGSLEVVKKLWVGNEPYFQLKIGKCALDVLLSRSELLCHGFVDLPLGYTLQADLSRPVSKAGKVASWKIDRLHDNPYDEFVEGAYEATPLADWRAYKEDYKVVVDRSKKDYFYTNHCLVSVRLPTGVHLLGVISKALLLKKEIRTLTVQKELNCKFAVHKAAVFLREERDILIVTHLISFGSGEMPAGETSDVRFRIIEKYETPFVDSFLNEYPRYELAFIPNDMDDQMSYFIDYRRVLERIPYPERYEFTARIKQKKDRLYIEEILKAELQ